MRAITRDELPEQCPHCRGLLKSYHFAGITRRVCKERCNGYEVVVEIDHYDELRGESGAIRMMDT